MIAQLDYHHGNTFSGIYRLCRPEIKTARNYSKYLACSLQDKSGELKAYAWLDRYVGDPRLPQMALIKVQGRLRWFDDQWIADLEQAYRHTEFIEHPLEIIPNSASPSPTGLERLECFLGNLSSTPLRKLLVTVMNNDNILLPFIALPASRQNHHAYPGGLLEHSLECAEFVSHCKQFSAETLELGAVAALLHDVGKVRTIGKDGRGTMIGRMLGHDLLTFEMLAEPLSQLDEEWRDGGAALRYLLSWKLQSRYGNKPLIVISEMIQAADRISSGIDNEKELFRDMPVWRQYASDENGRRAWRPKSIQLQ
jgi:3'-5' exoribonuclease